MAVIGVGDDAAALRRGCLHRERSRSLSAFGMSDEVLKLMWKLTTNLNQQLAAIGMPSARRRRLAAHSLRHLRLQLEFSSQLWRAAGICLQHLLVHNRLSADRPQSMQRLAIFDALDYLVQEFAKTAQVA